MASIRERLRTRALRSLFPVVFRAEAELGLLRLGTDYGGWWVPPSLLDADSICYLAGVGTDMSFDLALVQQFGCKVWLIDPTPRSIEWVAAQTLPSGMTFLPLGLAADDQIMRFYAPANPEHVSHSVANLQRTDRSIEAECRSVRSLMAQLGHDHVDLLKMDIEGAQHRVIESLLRDRVFPTVICVEMDQPDSLRRARESIARLRRVGYQVVKVEDFNLTLVKRDEPNA